MRTLAKTLSHAAAALGLAAAAVSPALADEAAKMTIDIETSDIDLATAMGQKLLDQRVEKAARTVCRVTEIRTGTRVMSRDARACLVKARTEARKQVAALTQAQQRGS